MYKKFKIDRKNIEVDIKALEVEIARTTDEEVRNKLLKQKDELEESLPDKRAKLNYGF